MKYLLTSIVVFTSFSIMSDPREMIMGLKKMDRDGNRAISFKEYSHKPQKLFQHMDSDSDGVLTYSEFSTNKLRPSKRNKNDHFSFLDINDDQKVSKEEFVSKANKQPRPKRMPKSKRFDYVLEEFNKKYPEVGENITDEDIEYLISNLTD